MSRASEHTPLLGRDGSQSGLTEMSIWKGTIDLAKATIPISASFALQNIVQALSIITSGKFGADQLDIASYGFMFATCTGSMVAIGGATALDTLCSQAVSSSKTQNHPTILGKHLQQSLFALSVLFCGIVVPIWVFSGNIFVALGQEHGFAMETGRFLILMIPGGYLQMVAECFKKYGQVQGSSNSVGYIVCVAAVAGIVANVVLINNVGLGAFGAPAAFFIYQLITVILLTVMIARKEREKQTFKLIRKWRDMVDSLGTNLFLGITGVLTIATEWWSFEILAIMATRLQPNEVSAQSILMSADLILTTVSLGIGVASSHTIGQLLGADRASLARRAAVFPYVLSVAIGLVEFAFIMAFRSKFGYMFTREDGVVATTAQILPLMAIFQILDLSNGGAGGILRGARRNHISGLCNFLSYYGVGLSLAWVFCFHLGWGLAGLWSGIISGSAALLVLQTVCVLLLPWQKIALVAVGYE